MTFLDRAEDANGYPNMAFEAFYQQGLSCFVWGLPRPLVRRAFERVCADQQARGKAIAMWQVRAFVYGMSGRYDGASCVRRVPDGYRWPSPPDASWELIVCVYPDGCCDLDLLHPISRQFWSEDNGLFHLPTTDRSLMNRDWFERMGFELMEMQPAMQVRIAQPTTPYLHLV